MHEHGEGGDEECDGRARARIGHRLARAQDEEIGAEAGSSADDAGGDGEEQHATQEPGTEALGIGHEREEEARDADGERADEREVAWQERELQGLPAVLQRQQHGQADERRDDRRVEGLGEEDVGDALDVAEHPAALRDHAWHDGELVVEQHQLRDRAGGG